MKWQNLSKRKGNGCQLVSVLVTWIEFGELAIFRLLVARSDVVVSRSDRNFENVNMQVAEGRRMPFDRWLKAGLYWL